MPMRLVSNLAALWRCIKHKYLLPTDLVLTVVLRVRGTIAGVVGAVLHVCEDNEKDRERQLHSISLNRTAG
jgi:RNAse (barnase) inhibitor barstar